MSEKEVKNLKKTEEKAQSIEELFGLFTVRRGVTDKDIQDGIVRGASRGVVNNKYKDHRKITHAQS